MKTLRWACFSLYAIAVIFVFYTVFSDIRMPRWWFFSRMHWIPLKYSLFYAGLFFASLLAVLLPTSRGNLVEIINPRILPLPAAAGSTVITAVLTALFAVLEDLLGVQAGIRFFIDGIIFTWAGWFVFFYIRYHDNPKFRITRNLAALTFAAGFLELLVSAAAHLSVRGRAEWFLYHPGTSTSMSVLTGLTVILWALGLGVAILFLNKEYLDGYNRWRQEIIKERGGIIEEI